MKYRIVLFSGEAMICVLKTGLKTLDHAKESWSKLAINLSLNNEHLLSEVTFDKHELTAYVYPDATKRDQTQYRLIIEEYE